MNTKEIDLGGPAFPIPITPEMGDTIDFPGMSLRDYFAAKAMQAFLSKATPEEIQEISNEIMGVKTVSKAAYIAADFMLEARKSSVPQASDA